MGTKVQCKTFLPIYCSMREYNSETSNGWPVFYEDLPRSMQLDDSSTSRYIDGFLEYDKLVLKQTMLKHEAIFRTQVFELHRLYGRQREMMDELKRQAQCGFALEARTSQSSATSPNLLQIDAANGVKRPSELSTSITRPSIHYIGDPPPHSFEGLNGTIEVQINCVSKAINVSKKDERLSQKIERMPKMLIDLQLPADAYIETEDIRRDDAEVGGKTLITSKNIYANGDIDQGHELSCNIGCHGDAEFQKSDLRLQHDSSSLNIADLNEPVKDLCFIEVCNSTSSMLPRKKSSYLRNQDNQLVLETCSSSGNICSNFSQDLHNGGCQFILQDTDLCHAPRTSNLKSSWEKPVCDIDIPANVGVTSLRPSMWKADCLPHQRSSSEMTYLPNGYHEKIQIGSNVSSDVKLPKMSCDKSVLFSAKTDTSLFDVLNTQKGFVRGLHDIDLNIGNDFNLNQTLPDGFSDEFSGQLEDKILEGNKCSMAIPWLNSSPWESFDLNRAIETEVDSQSSSKATVKGASLPQESHKDIVGPGTFMDPKQSRMGKEMPKNPGWENIIGVSTVDVVHKAEQGLHSSGFSRKAGSLDLETPLNEDQTVIDDDPGYKKGINLNLAATGVNDLKSSGNASDAEIQVLLKSSGSNITGRYTSIDLELPAETLKMLMPADLTHVSYPSVQKHMVDQKKDMDISEISLITAAEVIVSLSSRTRGCVESSSPLPEFPDLAELLWFAGVVTSQIGLVPDVTFSSSVGEEENHASSDVDGMDFFEAMTLRLTEPNVEDLLFKAPETENHEEDGGKFSSLLLAKPRRGQARRRRQKRDFQKDVLPGLASLSRQEVMEDLQTIGGMLRASGHDWQNSSSRRNNGRGGRGRRQQTRKAAATVMVEVPLELPLKEPDFAELEMEGMSIMGWGSTRRCRRPRCPPGSITAQAFT